MMDIPGAPWKQARRSNPEGNMACISAVEDHFKNGEMDEVTEGREEENGDSP